MAVMDATIPHLMSAVRCFGPKDYRVEMMPTLPPRGLVEGEVLVRVTRCGICAGDTKCYDGVAMFWGDNKGRAAYCETPVVPGHEFTGTVVALGTGASAKHGVEIGDSVVSEQVVACGSCLYCRKGMRWLCVCIYSSVNVRFVDATAHEVARYVTHHVRFSVSPNVFITLKCFFPGSSRYLRI
jgi:threonine dehydrogenase-like Zn-dependent dehydrogenase